ncbi:DNA polymerase III delta prime subunit [Litoreibacter ponti]|uniref:DNA polymerase III delta prime subunit n=1 Tax=Litoreibacter ponti TaxID=1510457 RepID=A0A2T6BJV6_9RHOB|nr:DNA polymerase III subunit delta' [Litoreibacter ponti]PTX56338.1 DNA polymerase III delta prime subunit [Litoreibacter ponti]
MSVVPADEALPQSDQIDGAPHPRETRELRGQGAAEAAFLDAFTGDRLHHAWMITGPRGVGKATLAWRLARFLLANPPARDDDMFGAPPPPTTLDIAPDHPITARMAAGSEPGLFVLRRPYDEDKKKFKQQITVDEVRKLKGFFSLSATEGGRRIVIVDAADEMNVSAANALLKVLEEPPADALLFLISHQPSRLLPTIRSRCRELRCTQLGAQDMAQALSAAGTDDAAQSSALTELSGGSVGEALRMIHLGGLDVYGELVALIGTMPDLDRPAAIALGEKAAARGQEARFELMLRLVDVLLARLARAGLGLPLSEAARGELATLARLSPNADAARRWATISADLSARAQHGRAVNLDPAALVLDMVLTINETAAKTAA